METSSTPPELAETAFLALLVKHEPALRAYARSLVPDWELVDEAIQEASITLWQKRHQLRDTDVFVPWAKTVLRFKCLRQLESLRTRRPLLSNEMLQTLAEHDMLRSGDGANARAEAFDRCLSQFSQEHQELLLAPHRSTQTVVDVAAKRRKSPNSLYKLLARLRQQLSECVKLRLAAEVR